MPRRSVLALLLGTVLALPGCREYSLLEEEIVPIQWVQVEGDLDFSTIAISADGQIYGAVRDEGGPLLRSDDRGVTWQTVLTISPDWQFLGSGLATGPQGEVYATVMRPAGSGGALREIGVVRSVNGGDWQLLPRTWIARSADALRVTSNGSVLLGTQGSGIQGLYRSADGGQTWHDTPLKSSSAMASGGILRGTLTAGPDGIAMARLYGAGPDYDGLYRTTDHGQSWVRLPAVDFDVETLTIASEDVVFATGNLIPPRGASVFRSGNLGEAWGQDPAVLPVNRIRGMAPNPQDYLYLAAGNAGVLRSDDGYEWEAVNEGLPAYNTGILTIEVFQVLLAPDGYLYANTDEGLYRSTGRAE